MKQHHISGNKSPQESSECLVATTQREAKEELTRAVPMTGGNIVLGTACRSSYLPYL